MHIFLLWLDIDTREGFKLQRSLSPLKELKSVACGILAVWAISEVSPVIAANQVKKCSHLLFHKLCAEVLKYSSTKKLLTFIDLYKLLA